MHRLATALPTETAILKKKYERKQFCSFLRIGVQHFYTIVCQGATHWTLVYGMTNSRISDILNNRTNSTDLLPIQNDLLSLAYLE